MMMWAPILIPSGLPPTQPPTVPPIHNVFIFEDQFNMGMGSISKFAVSDKWFANSNLNNYTLPHSEIVIGSLQPFAINKKGGMKA